MNIDKQITDGLARQKLIMETAKRSAAFHSAYIAALQFNEFVVSAPFIKETAELHEEAQALFTSLATFYNKVGEVAFPNGEMNP